MVIRGNEENNMATSEPKTANDLAGERTDLAVERTVMAANRTLMAWVRTALSLIGFGFTIYKFLQAAIGTENAKLILIKMEGPRRLGLILIAFGTLAVILGAIEYFGTVKRLNRQSTTRYNPWNFSFILGIAIGLLGLLLFITILINREVF
jgi:putative membrane protein